MQKKDNYFKSLYSVIFDMMAEDNAKRERQGIEFRRF